MFRTLALSLALASAPALAGGYYQAQPAAQPAQERFVARENVWRCDGQDCTSTRTATRPAIVCATLVREVGRLNRFTVDGRAFADEELENCNRRAR